MSFYRDYIDDTENLKITSLDKLGYIVSNYDKNGKRYYASYKEFTVLGYDQLRVRFFDRVKSDLYYETEIINPVKFGNQKSLNLSTFLCLMKLEKERQRIYEFLNR